MTRRSILCLAGVPLVATSVAQATFLNAPIQLEYVVRDGQGAQEIFQQDAKNATEELGTSVEFPAFNPDEPTFDVDIDTSTIRIDHFVEQGFESDQFAEYPFLGLVFSDVANKVPPIASVTIVPSPFAMPGLVVTHSDDAIEVNWQGLTFTSTTRIDLAVTFGADQPIDPIPEPATLAANGLFVLLLAGRRRRRSTSAA